MRIEFSNTSMMIPYKVSYMCYIDFVSMWGENLIRNNYC